MAHGQTFALANITSVGSGEIPASVGGFVLLALFGAAVALAGVLAMTSEFKDVLIKTAILLAGIIVGVLGIYGAKAQKPTYFVVLNTAGGEIKTCHSKERDLITRIVAALNDAIVARG